MGLLSIKKQETNIKKSHKKILGNEIKKLYIIKKSKTNQITIKKIQTKFNNKKNYNQILRDENEKKIIQLVKDFLK